MPANAITALGLTTQTLAEILAELENGADGFPGLRAIYGADINLDPNTPDGQLLHLFAQGKIDVLEFLTQIYNSFDPDQAIGRVLDQRCALNGVVRRAGTYTQQAVAVTATQAVTIYGLDDNPTNPFTVSDSAGNQFYLLETHSFSGAGTTSLAFRAKELGEVLTTPNTVTQIVTVTLGITTVNNPSAASVVGTNEESDAELRLRRMRSVSLPSKGYLDGLYGALLAVDGVEHVLILENITNATDGNGVPGHSIWVVVRGGANAAVAQAIYLKRNAGCGMKGSVSVNINQVDGSLFAVLFDRPTDETLWIKFNATAITGTVDESYIRSQLLAQLSYGINAPADASAIVALLKEIAPNAYYDTEGVSRDGVTYSALLYNTTPNQQWALAAARVVINGSPG